jgi:hypothetical protein
MGSRRDMARFDALAVLRKATVLPGERQQFHLGPPPWRKFVRHWHGKRSAPALSSRT